MSNVHERPFRIVYDDHIIALTELLMTKNERTIHQQNINVLMKEIPPLIDVSISQNKL